MPDINETPPVETAGLEATVSATETSQVCSQEEVPTIESGIVPEPDSSIAYLMQLAPLGPWVMTAILSDENNPPPGWPAKGKTFTRTLYTIEQVRDWVLRCANGKVNLYYTHCLLRSPVNIKPSKDDCVATAFLHSDIDPRVGEDLVSEQARMRAEIAHFAFPPTVTVFSGGGYQLLWRLAEPHSLGKENTDADLVVQIEDRNRWLQSQFLSGDNTHNVERLLRLPGSINWPDKRKLAKGRKPTLSYVVDELSDWSRSVPLEQIPLLQYQPKSVHIPASMGDLPAERLESLNKLKEWSVPDDLVEVIASGKAERHPSRSESLFYVCCSLVRYGVPDSVIYGILTDDRFGISESVREFGGKAEAYAKRQIARAQMVVDNEIVMAGGMLPSILDKAQFALLNAEVPIYQRGEMLVRLAQLEETQKS